MQSIIDFLIMERKLVSQSAFFPTDWSLNDKIHSLKGFLLLIPDDTLFSIIQ